VVCFEKEKNMSTGAYTSAFKGYSMGKVQNTKMQANKDQ
jgi:hypothetical protein